MVYFHHQAVSAGSHRGPTHRYHLITAATGMARIGDNWKMTFFLNHRDGTQVQSVAGMVGKSADATLAENHIVIPFGHDVFGSH